MLMFPEILIILTAFLVLILDLVFMNEQKRWLNKVALLGVFASAMSTIFLMRHLGGTSEALFGGRFLVSPLGLWFKLIFLLATWLTLAISQAPFEPSAKQPLHARSEFIVVMLFALSGMMALISSQDLVSLYVSLELATIPLFALTAWQRTERAGEGAIKYLVMGALGSAFLIYGFGFLYGLTGQTSLTGIAHELQPTSAMWLAAGLITAGIGFKLTLFPFHMWAPDAYEASSTPVTAFLSVTSKTAGLAVAFQLYYIVFGAFIEHWAPLVAVFAAATMTLGNLVAVRQSNLKRFMAYSSISQAGYLILGFLGKTGADASAMVFYMAVYVLTNLAVFGVLILHVHQSGREDIESLKGLSQKNPILSLAMMIGLFGLAGIPPLSGFVGKFLLFNVAAKAGYYWLVAVAAINSTVSLYYYLRLIRQMYIEPADDKNGTGLLPLKSSPSVAFAIGLATIGSVICGLIPFFYQQISVNAAQWLAQF